MALVYSNDSCAVTYGACFIGNTPPSLTQDDIMLAPSCVLPGGAVHLVVVRAPIAPVVGDNVTVPAWEPQKTTNPAALPPRYCKAKLFGPELVLE